MEKNLKDADLEKVTGGDSICNDIPVPEPSFGTTEDVINKFKKFNNFSDPEPGKDTEDVINKIKKFYNFSDPEFGNFTEDALNRFKKLNNITDEN